MKIDDLILVSIDDHVVEPPDMFVRHVPAKYKDEAPIVVTDDKGVDQWIYQGRPQGVSGLNAVVSWPAEEWGRDPAGFAEMRPGVYDVHDIMDRSDTLPNLRWCIQMARCFHFGERAQRFEAVEVMVPEWTGDNYEVKDGKWVGK